MRLSERSFEYAKQLIREGKRVLDERDDWSEHQPSAEEDNRFIEDHGWDEYGRWHLGIDEQHGGQGGGGQPEREAQCEAQGQAEQPAHAQARSPSHT